MTKNNNSKLKNVIFKIKYEKLLHLYNINFTVAY